MKKLIVDFIFLFFSFMVFSAPFGLKMGMTLKDIESVCTSEPEYIADDRYYIQPIKSHPRFDGYIVWVSESNGLYYIKGISNEIATTNYGNEIKLEFSKILSSLERKYGKFKKIDNLAKDALWNEDKYWMKSIASGSRIYEAEWEASVGDAEKFEGLISISLGIKTSKSYVDDRAYIWIEYEFSNAANGFDDLDDVL